MTSQTIRTDDIKRVTIPSQESESLNGPHHFSSTHCSFQAGYATARKFYTSHDQGVITISGSSG